jgi:uncharacterized membrane protein
VTQPQSTSRAPSGQDNPRDMEILISTVLRTGVVLSLALVVLGTVLTFVHHPEYLGSAADLKRLTHPHDVSRHPLSDLLNGLHQLRGQAVVTLGLLLLIATPIVRVAISAFAFARQGDRVFTILTLAVLGILLLSLLLGAAE